MPELDVRLLGSLQLKQDGQKSLTGFESNKVRALLAYLVVEATRPHRRRHLAALLWPEISESKALTNLRHVLANLRRVIADHVADPPYLIITPQTIQFNQDSDILVDVCEFERCVTLAQAHPLDIDSLHRAAELYRGQFLEGFSIPDSIPFEEWLLAKREHFESLTNWVLQRLADEYELAGEYGKAVDFAQRQIRHNPWREEVHQQIMRCLYYSGQRSAAIAQYEACCSSLKADLGLMPSQETQTLYAQICENQLPIPPTPPSFLQHIPSAIVAKPDFVGREEPLKQLHVALTQMMGGQGQLLLITGSPGQGKTALMREFIRQALERHPTLAAAWGNGQAYFGSGDPFLPFREILEMLSGHVEHRWASGSVTQDHARRMWRLTGLCARALVQEGPALVNSFIPGPPLLARASQVTKNDPPWLVELETRVSDQSRAQRISQEDVFQQYWRVLGAISQQVPLLLFVDDLQWADLSSLGLLFYLSNQLSTAPIMIVGAFRPIEDQAAFTTDEPSLGALVTELQLRHGDLLINLDAYAQREFIDAYLDLEPNHLEENFRQTLFRLTHSHPLYTVEMLRGMRERGDVVKDEVGKWVVSESLNWEQLPSRVEAAIEARMHHLCPRTVHLLKIASVEGERFTGEIVAQVVDAEEGLILTELSEELEQNQRLVQAESCQLVDGNRLSRYRFRHILIQKFLYNQLNLVERAILHGKVGEVLEKLYESNLDEISVALALHFELAGNPQKAIHYLDLAGQKAIRLSSYEEAIIHFKKALSLLARQPGEDEKNQLELRLLMHLSTPMRFRSGYAAMDFGCVCDRMLELLNSVAFNPEMFPVFNALFDYFDLVGEYKRALSILETINTLSDRKLDLWVNLQHWGYGCIFLSLGKFEESAYHSQKMVAFYDINEHGEFRQIYGSDPGVSSLINYAWALYPLGYPQQAIARCQQAMELGKHLNDLDNQLFSQIFSAYLFVMMRELEKADELMQSCKTLLAGQSAKVFSAMMIFMNGVIQSYQGDEHLGLANISLGIENLQSLGMCGRLSVHLAIQSEVLLMYGQIDKAIDCLRQAEDFIKETTEGIYPAEVQRLKGECLRCEARDEEAELCFLQAQEIARGQNAKSLELRVVMSLARLWQSQGRIKDAYGVLADVFSWFTEGFQMHDLRQAQSILEELRVNL